MKIGYLLTFFSNINDIILEIELKLRSLSKAVIGLHLIESYILFNTS